MSKTCKMMFAKTLFYRHKGKGITHGRLSKNYFALDVQCKKIASKNNGDSAVIDLQKSNLRLAMPE